MSSHDDVRDELHDDVHDVRECRGGYDVRENNSSLDDYVHVRGHDDDDVHARDHDPRNHSRSGHRRDDGVLHVHVPHAHVHRDGRGRNRSHRNPWTPWNSSLISLPYEISLKFI